MTITAITSNFSNIQNIKAQKSSFQAINEITSTRIQAAKKLAGAIPQDATFSVRA